MNTLDSIIRDRAVFRELNKIYGIRWGLRKTRVHTKGVQRNRKPETNSVSLSRERRYSWRDETYCKSNSAHSRSLPPLVNHCNIHARGEYVVKVHLPHPRDRIHTNIQSARETFRVPTDRTLELRNSIETAAARSNCDRVVGCYRLKLREGRRENMNGECNENSCEKFNALITPSRIKLV